MSDPYAGLRQFSSRGRRSAEPIQIGKVVSEFIALKGLAQVEGQAQLQKAWREVAGEVIAKSSATIGLSRGILQIGVANNALLSELASFHKRELLEKLQAQHPHLKVKDLRFRLKTDVVRKPVSPH